MHALARTCGIVLVLSLLAPPARPATVTFTKIADTTTAIPTGGGTFNGFGISYGNAIAPAIDGRNVAFVGSRTTSGLEGVYFSRAGSIARVADRTMTAPVSGAQMSGFRGLDVDGDNVVFYSSGDTANGTFFTGVYKRVGGALVHVTSSGGGYSNPVLDGNNAYVFGDGPAGDRIYTDAGGTLRTIVRTGDPAPGGGTFYSLNGNVSAANGDVVFYGGPVGIYRTRNGKLEVVANSTTPVAGRPGHFNDFSNTTTAFDGTDAAFVADHTGGRGIFRTLNDQIVAVAIAGAVVPGHGSLALTNPILSMDAGHIAFADRNAILTDVGGSLQRVVGGGDQVLGKTVSSVAFGSQGLSGDNLAFYARFTDGSAGIFVADLTPPPPPTTPVPLPPALLCGTVAGAWTLLRKQRRR